MPRVELLNLNFLDEVVPGKRSEFLRRIIHAMPASNPFYSLLSTFWLIINKGYYSIAADFFSDHYQDSIICEHICLSRTFKLS